MTSSNNNRFLFGEFQLVLESRSLMREGETISLSSGAFEILLHLVKNAQRLVPREELLRLTGRSDNTSDKSLDQLILVLQRDLTASLPGDELLIGTDDQGFRLALPVMELDVSTSDAGLILHDDHHPSVGLAPISGDVPSGEGAILASKESATNKVGARSETPQRNSKVRKASSGTFRWRRLLLSIAGVFGVAIFCLVCYRIWRTPRRATTRLVVMRVANLTGDSILDGTAGEAMRLALEASPTLYIEPPFSTDDKTASATGDSFSAQSVTADREVCGRIAAQAILIGDIAPLGSRLLLTMKIVDCATGLTLAETHGVAAQRDDVLPLLGRISVDLRRQLGESTASIHQFSSSTLNSGAVSLVALHAYAAAIHSSQNGDVAGSVSLLHQAVALSPSFVSAWIELATTQASQGKMDESERALRQAFDLKGAAEEATRLSVTSLYAQQVQGDLVVASSDDRRWSELYPLNPNPLLALAEMDLVMGQAEDALSAARRALILDPLSSVAQTILVRALMAAGHVDEAAEAARHALAIHSDTIALHELIFQIASMRHETTAMDNELAWAQGHGATPYLVWQQGAQLFADGKVTAARLVFRDLISSLRAEGKFDFANRIEAWIPRRLAQVGLTAEAAATLQALDSDAGGDDESDPDLAVAWALTGNVAKAEQWLQAEDARHNKATVWRENTQPQIEAAIALASHQSQQAVDALKAALPMDLAGYDVSELRGEALLQAHQPAMAEYEFLKILDHPGIQPVSIDYPLAQLGLARALAAENKVTNARFAYRTFFQRWQEADATLPILRAAHMEYERLPRDSGLASLGVQPQAIKPKVAQSANGTSQ